MEKKLWEGNERIDDISTRSKSIVAWLMMLLSLWCGFWEKDFSDNDVEAFVEAFDRIERLDADNIVDAMSIIEEIIAEIENNKDFRAYLWPQWAERLDAGVLLALSIAETRANSSVTGPAWEWWLFQIWKPTQEGVYALLKARWASNNSLNQVATNPHLAWALAYGSALNIVNTHRLAWDLDNLSRTEELQLWYIIHNTWPGWFRRHFLDKWYRNRDDFASAFFALLAEEWFTYKQWKRDTKRFNKQPANARKQKKINKLVWLQSTKKYVRNPELKKTWNAFVSWYLIGLSYSTVQEVATG